MDGDADTVYQPSVLGMSGRKSHPLTTFARGGETRPRGLMRGEEAGQAGRPLEGRGRTMKTTETPAVQGRGHDVVAQTAGGEKAERPGALGYVLALLRIGMGWTFLWAFLDKTFGLGFATPAENAWIDGGSPTTGYLSNVDGPFESVFTGMAGQAWADWLFMVGLLGIGLALLLGIGMRIAAVTGGLLLAFMYLAALPLETNPFMDSHLIEILVLAAVALAGAGRVLGLGGYWERLPLVRTNRWLV